VAKPFSALPGILDKRRRELNDSVNRVSRAAALEAGRVAVVTTRVDTGEARSNWIASNGSPASKTIPAYSPGIRRGINERANASAARAQHKVVSTSWKANKGRRFFIANNVDHIGRLNFGGPNNSADNMLGKAVLAWKDFFTKRRVIKLFKG
jgi:hypothetical protein